MKMLTKEGTQVNVSFGIVLDLLECHSGHGRDFLHHQICNQLDCHHGICSLSAAHSHPVNLQVILKPSPEMLYGVMLLPDGDGFTSSQLPPEDHETFELGAVHEEHQYHFAEGWAFCFLPGYWYAFASPGGIIQLYLLLVQGELLFLAIYGEYIVALGMNQYLVKALLLVKPSLFEYLHQVIRTIPAVESDGKISQVNAFLTEHFHQLMDHLPEYIWLGCVTPTLFANRSDTQGDDPFSYLHGYGYDVLTPDYIMMSSTEPAIGKTHDITHSVYDSVINTEGNPLPGQCCWAFGKCFSYKLLYLRQSSIHKQLSQMIYAPGVNGVIDVVLVKTKSLYELIGSEYVEHMSVSQHQQYLHRFLLTSCEVSVEKLLKLLNAFVNLIYHLCLLMILVAFSLNTTYKEALFFLYCQGFMRSFLTSREFSVTEVRQLAIDK
jgi:hypothetical protein